MTDERSLKYLQRYLAKDQTFEKLTTDINWGCTLRVGQMLVANTILKHLLIEDKNFHYRSPHQFEESQLYLKLSQKTIDEDPTKKKIYLNVLNHILDNEYPEEFIEGVSVKPH